MTDASPRSARRVWAVASGDSSPQVLTCAAAAPQVLLPVFYGPRFRGPDSPPDVIQPAPYAFTVWFPIFASSIAYAVHQARRTARTRTIWRAAGWPLAGAFASAGIWAPLARAGRFWSAQAALVSLAALSETARRRVARAERRNELRAAEVAAVAPAAGMLAAWGQAACGVNLAALLVDRTIVPAGRPADTVGAALLATLGAFGAAAVSAPERSTVSSRFYAGTLLWAFVGVVIGQRRRSRSAAVTAAGAAVTMLAVAASRR